ncbi:MAG: hypothetical protein ACE5JU_21155 [Candidatus Binatia bacterium]
MAKRHHSMVEFRQVPIRIFPTEFAAAIHEQIRLFSVTMVVDRGGKDAYTCAGTLCKISGNRGIITARHVWERLSREREVLVLAGRAHVPLDPRLLCPVVPSAVERLPKSDAEIPDIAFLRIPDCDCVSLEAHGKVFYSLDRRLLDPQIALYTEHGYWALYGAPQALLDPRYGAASSFMYGTSISNHFEFGTWDYFEINLDVDANPAVPSGFHGCSGGGVWQTFWLTNEAATEFRVANRYKDIVLKGVNFWQTERYGGKVVAHGPRSIYQLLQEQVSATYVHNHADRD